VDYIKQHNEAIAIATRVVAVNVAAPDEGNMYLLGKVGTPWQKERFLAPLLSRQRVLGTC
jgi:hypothetical protein